MKISFMGGLAIVISVAVGATALSACGGGSSGSKGPAMVADSTDDNKPLPGFESDKDGDGGAGHASSGGGEGGAGDSPPGTILKGDDDGAKALLTQFVNPSADHAALTRSLRPTSADFKTLFDAATASKAESVMAKEWDSGKAIIKPKANQTEVKIWSATGSDLQKGTGNAKEFPGGYKKIAKHLSASVLFFRFKFVEAGKDTGTAYDGLAFVNGHWVIAPKPWRVVDGGKGGGTEGEDDGAPNGGGGDEKPKPKPKGKPKKK